MPLEVNYLTPLLLSRPVTLLMSAIAFVMWAMLIPIPLG